MFRRRRRRRAVQSLAICLLVGGALRAQTASPPPAAPATSEIERLTHLGKLWGVVRYLHPYLAYRDIDWDAAFLAAVPKVRSAASAAQYRDAVQSMLAPLGDLVTHVLDEPKKEEGPAPPPHPLLRWLGATEEVLCLDLRPGFDPLDPKVSRGKGSELDRGLRKAQRVVIDIRSRRGDDYSPEMILDILGATELLASHPATAPPQRYLVHSGYSGQTFRGSGGYFSGFLTLFSETFAPTEGAGTKRIVFLADHISAIPPIALALQAAGDGAILLAGSEGEELSEEAVVRTRDVDLGSGLTARVRTSELVPVPGFPGLHADRIVRAPSGKSDSGVGPGEANGEDPFIAEAVRLTTPQASTSAAASTPVPPLPPGRAQRDKTYPEALDPSPELRLLAVVRFWNVIDLFYPYKGLIGDWEAVLPEFLAKMAASRGARGYAWTLAEMAARVTDGHTGISGHPELASLFGQMPAPFSARWIEGGCVVTALRDAPEVKASGIEAGDVVVEVDGQPIEKRMAEIGPYVTGSTETFRQTRLCGRALAGAKGATGAFTLRGLDDKVKKATLPREPWAPAPAGEAVRVLPQNIGYVDLTRLTTTEVDAMFEKLKGTRAIVFDMRGYPHGTAWSIAPRIDTRNGRAAATFRRAFVSAGSTFDEGDSGFYFAQPLPKSDKWKYAGPTVMLIDERAISQSEHSGLFYESANGTRFIGTPSAGANGDVTDLTLPGGIEVYFTGHDVRHADGRQLQRVGLVPDVAVAPTRKGLHDGKDEVLDRAVEVLEADLGRPAVAVKP
jgi:C-terminal processing protease CtpA/Prc